MNWYPDFLMFCFVGVFAIYGVFSFIVDVVSVFKKKYKNE